MTKRLESLDRNCPELIGESPAFLSALRTARLVAVSDVTLFIQGESGTGKEVLTRHIHHLSPRSKGPLISVNCAALPESLVESELFGHRRGAFTGADQDYPGKARAAAGGTLFLDEISELPLSMQAKLLRFLEAGECQGLGEPAPVVVDVRVIAATNRNLYQMVQAGKFRADLYYRLNVVPLLLPPLRERLGDLPLLLQHFTTTLAEQHGVQPPHYGKAVMKILQRYHWPGNVRELRNFCERMVVLFSGMEVETGNLPPEITQPVPQEEEGGSNFTLPEGGIKLESLERELIIQALSRAGGNRSRAARLLGLTRDTFLYRMRKHGIE